MGNVQLRVERGIAVLTLDNPPLNVLSIHMGEQIGDTLYKVAENNDIYAVIITGAGEKAFMAGADIKEFPRYIEEDTAEEMALGFDETMTRLHELGKPTIAALNGLTLGGGCELSLACDFRLAEAHVMIGLPEIKLGVFPGAGGTQRLPRLIGEARAKEMILTGEPVTAAEALKIGLVHRVVDKGTVLQAAMDFAANFKTKSLVSMKYAKRAIDQGRDLPLDEGLRLEATLFGRVFRSEDAREGITAFIEKRPPNFKHR